MNKRSAGLAAALFAAFCSVAVAQVIKYNGGIATNLSGTALCANGTSVNINSGTLYIDCTNTRVGVNTTSPQQIFHVLGTASSRAIMVNSPQAAATGTGGTPVAEFALFAEPYGSANSSMLDLLAYSTGTVQPLFRIANHWENTATPATSSSGTIAMGFYTGSTYNDVLVISTLSAVGVNQLNPLAALHVVSSTTAGTAAVFRVDNNAGTSLLRLQQNGNVGLATTNPATLLHMSSGTITVDGNTTLELSLGGQTAITNAVVQVTTGTTGPATLSVFNNGAVSIGGRTTPTAGTLTVAYGNNQNNVFWIGDNNNSAFGPRSLRMGNTQALGGGLMEEQTYNGNSNNEPLVLQRLGGGVVIGGATGNATLSVVAGSMTISGTSAALGLNTTTPGTLFHMSSGTLTIDGNVNPGLRMDPQLQVQASSGAVGTPGYAFNGGTNTGMYSSGANRLDFATGGTNALAIDSAQNAVFAAVVTANNRFVVPAGQSIYLESSGRNAISDGGGDRFSITAGGGVRLRIETDGSVGINTTADMVPELVVVSSQAATQDVFAVSSQTTTTIMFSVRGSGGVMHTQRTKAQFDTLTPTGVGEIFQCSNCTVSYALCHATGTAVAQFAREGSATVGCGSGE